MSHNKLSQRALEQVYWDNVRTQQIGEIAGISPDVAAEIGYVPLQDALAPPQIPSDARLLIDEFRSKTERARNNGTLPLKGTGLDSDLGATTRYVHHTGMPFHAPRTEA